MAKTVKVIDRWRIVHEGVEHLKGDVFTVEDNDNPPSNPSDEWVEAGWVEVVPAKPPAKAVPPKAAPRKARSG